MSRAQTKDLASRYERALQESEAATEKCKNRLDVTSEELERLLLQKEGESYKDTGVKAQTGGGKRAIGKAVGGLLKGKNPGNVCPAFHLLRRSPHDHRRSSARKKMCEHAYHPPQTSTGRL